MEAGRLECLGLVAGPFRNRLSAGSFFCVRRLKGRGRRPGGHKRTARLAVFREPRRAVRSSGGITRAQELPPPEGSPYPGLEDNQHRQQSRSRDGSQDEFHGFRFRPPREYSQGPNPLMCERGFNPVVLRHSEEGMFVIFEEIVVRVALA